MLELQIDKDAIAKFMSAVNAPTLKETTLTEAADLIAQGFNLVVNQRNAALAKLAQLEQCTDLESVKTNARNEMLNWVIQAVEAYPEGGCDERLARALDKQFSQTKLTRLEQHNKVLEAQLARALEDNSEVNRRMAALQGALEDQHEHLCDLVSAARVRK